MAIQKPLLHVSLAQLEIIQKGIHLLDKAYEAVQIGTPTLLTRLSHTRTLIANVLFFIQ